MGWIHDHLPKDWGRLPTLPTTNYKILVGARLAYATAIFYFTTELRGKKVDSINFALWLGFVAAWAAISYAQYRTSRTTDYEYVNAKAGNTPASPVMALKPMVMAAEGNTSMDGVSRNGELTAIKPVRTQFLLGYVSLFPL